MSPKILATRAAIVLAIFLSVGAGQQPNPLVEAVKRADQDRKPVAELVRQRVDPNSADAYGSTALHWAAEMDDLQTVQLLLKAGASPKAVNRYGVAPLTLAATNGNAAIIGALVAAGADANTTAPGGETALMTASVSYTHLTLPTNREV